MSGKQAIPFHGILAVGNTKDEAINRYRLLARGKGVSAMVDESQKMAFVTHASNKIAEMFNPKTGELDLQHDDSLLNDMNFEAKAGDGEVVANHYVCESGCGLHIVYDDDNLVHHCPACTTAIASDDDEDEDSDEDEESEDDDEDESEDEDSDEEDEDEESESADEDEDDSEEDEESDDEDDSEEDEDDSEEDESDEDDEEDADAEDDDDSGEPLVIAADSKESAIEIYRQNRQGIATAATTVEVDYMVCSSAECNAHVLSEDPNLDKCPACTSALKQPEAAAVPPATESNSSEDEEDEDDDENDMQVVDEDQDDEDDEDEDEESESSAETSAPVTAPAAPAPAAPANAEPENGGAAPVAESSEPPKENAMSETAEKITVNMLTQVNDSHEGLDLSFSGSIVGKPMWTAYYNGLPIATASKVDAGKNADIFDNPAFGNAVIAGAKHVGMKETLNEMGFKGIAHEISISSVVKNLVDTQVTTASEELSRDRKEHAQRLMSAMATSAIGINRGFFPDIKNPIKAALWNAMSSAGVKNAEVLIDNAFKAGSDAYHTALFAKAAEIIDNPLEVQESLSKAVLGSNYMAVSESSATGASPLENRLENFGSVTASAAPAAKPAQEDEPEESVSSDVQISNVVAGLGRRR